jgi:hypothetical protein
MTTDAIRAVETTPANPARDEFMRLLTEHEDIIARLYLTATSKAPILEAFRMSRRAVVAAYDRACLLATPRVENADDAAA